MTEREQQLAKDLNTATDMLTSLGNYSYDIEMAVRRLEDVLRDMPRNRAAMSRLATLKALAVKGPRLTKGVYPKQGPWGPGTSDTPEEHPEPEAPAPGEPPYKRDLKALCAAADKHEEDLRALGLL